VNVPGLSVNPNPFPQTVTLAYQLSRTSKVECEIFDASGRRIRTLYSGSQGAGVQNLTWDRRDDRGRIVNAGVYFARLSAGQATTQAKLVVLE
jgi:flagellar hook assembly protein FlgD